jgi:hypothetical protein
MPLPPETGASWTEVQSRLGAATSIAKRLNVTLAVRNSPHTFAAGVHDMKRVSKEADSAWLRYGPDFATLDAGSEAQALLPKSVLVWANISAELGTVRSLLDSFRGFVVLDAAAGDANVEQLKNALRLWRSAFGSAVDRT